jgi:hypothetical protein
MSTYSSLVNWTEKKRGMAYQEDTITVHVWRDTEVKLQNKNFVTVGGDVGDSIHVPEE